MKTIRGIAIAGAMALMSAAAPAVAADSGFYLGAGTGQAQMEDNPSQLSGANIDESSTPYRVFGGYRLGIIPVLDFAAEVGYRDLGEAKGTQGANSFNYKLKGADASALVIFPLLGFDFFGKAGVIRYDLDKTFNGATTGFSGTAPLYGFGVGFRFWRLGIRAEVERLDVDDLKRQDVGMVSVYFRF
jgi:OOP family OmpA-OmpF porin